MGGTIGGTGAPIIGGAPIIEDAPIIGIIGACGCPGIPIGCPGCPIGIPMGSPDIPGCPIGGVPMAIGGPAIGAPG